MAVVNWLEIGAVQDADLGGTVWVEPGAFEFPESAPPPEDNIVPFYKTTHIIGPRTHV